MACHPTAITWSVPIRFRFPTVAGLVTRGAAIEANSLRAGLELMPFFTTKNAALPLNEGKHKSITMHTAIPIYKIG